MKWYVMTVFNGKEKSIKEKIEKEIEERGFGDLINQVLVPIEQYWHLKNGKKVKAERNYFPGYLMIECELTDEVSRVVNHVKGVLQFLGARKPGEVQDMLKKVDALEAGDEVVMETSLIIGQKVEIVEGPFQSMSGTITEILKEKQKIKVDVNIFNRVTPLELGFEQVNG